MQTISMQICAKVILSGSFHTSSYYVHIPKTILNEM